MEKIMVEVDRRTLVASVAALAAIGSAPTAAVAQAPTSVAPLAPAVPLPFSPASLGWLSERLIVSHHDNNYTGAVKRLSQIRSELADIDPATMAGYRLNGLKREELIAWNSMILHELYFAGLGRPSQPAPSLAQAIERDFGSLSRWAQEYAAMGKALGGGSGWVLLTWSHRDKRLVNQWAADHTMTWPEPRRSSHSTCMNMPMRSILGRRLATMSTDSCGRSHGIMLIGFLRISPDHLGARLR